MDCNAPMQAYELGAATYVEKDHQAHAHGSLIHPAEVIVVLSLLRNIVFNDVLDAGTGAGRYAVRLAEMGKRVVGIDTSPQMLAQARAKANELRLAIDFRQASVLAVPQADESFDLVICAFTLAHVKDLAGAVRELVRVLRCGGHLIITDLHPVGQKIMGPNYTAFVSEGRLIMSPCGKETLKAHEPNSAAIEVPFPQYHGEVDEYVDSVRAAGAELLAAIDVPILPTEQAMGLVPGALVVFARKGAWDRVEPAAARRR
jgi:2-polyprenyl-3-methyl-5-hydroxy-6-metoxy-1,4-benzoquinol methylase